MFFIEQKHGANGSLDQKLMSAMQSAKIPGADTRCLDEGISTLSAFIRIAKPGDIDYHTRIKCYQKVIL